MEMRYSNTVIVIIIIKYRHRQMAQRTKQTGTQREKKTDPGIRTERQKQTGRQFVCCLLA